MLAEEFGANVDDPWAGFNPDSPVGRLCRQRFEELYGVPRIPEIRSYDDAVILFCNEGYASSLAAATLQQLGLHRATDLIGGFQAWRAAGLPTAGNDGR